MASGSVHVPTSTPSAIHVQSEPLGPLVQVASKVLPPQVPVQEHPSLLPEHSMPLQGFEPPTQRNMA